MPTEPVPADPGPGDDPDRGAAEPDGPWWEDGWEEDPVPDHRPWAQILAECHEAAQDQASEDASLAAQLGRRGPGQPGSAEVFPGEYPGPAAQFAAAGG
jgi:hypothetical protein